MTSKLFFKRSLALAALIFAVRMLFVAISPATQAAPPSPDKDGSKYQLEAVDVKSVEVLSWESESGLYLVKLEGEPLSTYRGGIAGLRATMPSTHGEAKLDVNSPDSVAYLQYLAEKHNEFIALVESTLCRSINVKYLYGVVYNDMII